MWAGSDLEEGSVAKVAVAVRLAPDVVAWADGFAKSRGCSRQVVLEAAVLAYREDAAGGVSVASTAVLPKLSSRSVPVEVRGPALSGPREWALERQRKLNAGRGRS
jgi:hypothetical protein